MNHKAKMTRRQPKWMMLLTGLLLLLLLQPDAGAFTLNVQDPAGNPVSGFRWIVEKDTTNHTVPGVAVANSLGLDIHNSYNPVVLKGHSATNTADVNVPGGTRYFVSVLPDADYAMGGAPVEPNQAAVSVFVQPQPIPTAQISILVFVDNNPINNIYDAGEQGLGGATIILSELGGAQMTDAFGNMLGTTYQRNLDGSFVLDPDGAPIVDMMGSGVITTLTQEDFDAGNNPYNLKVGEALIKYVAPNKYGIVIVPPGLDDNGDPMTWSQTSTIEGTPTVDAWVKANEPTVFVEGFGTGFNHCFFGFVKTAPVTDSPSKGQTLQVLPWNSASPPGTGSIQGRLRYNHFSRPPLTQGFFPGAIIGEGWVGLNNPFSKTGLYAAPCNPDGTFVINNVPPGDYQLVTWDTPLDNLFGFHNVTVGPGENVDLGDVLEYRWFGTLEGSVFLDNGAGDPTKAGNGFRDPGEMGIMQQNINIRFRDGTIYQAQPTDMMGEYEFSEVFPFFKWLVVEVDFARFKATGMTTVVDAGGEVLPDLGWAMPSRDKLNPQVQIDMDPCSPTFGLEIINPNTGNALARTEVGPVLTEAMHLFLNQTNVIDWGKTAYGTGKNGGISGIVFYDTTRAENDPRFCVGEPWQPGIPNVQVNLYADANCNGVIDDLDGDGGVTLADVDNYPFGWMDDPNQFEAGVDVDRNGNGSFDPGDAIQVATTDSWDDSKPTGSIGPFLNIHGEQVPVGMDAFATWNQVREGIFDGGYAFTSYHPGGMASGSPEVDGLPTGMYIVEATTPPGYELVKEEDKNVDFGDTYTPSQLLLPPICVGAPHPVPDFLTLFPGVECAFAGQVRPLADRKQISVMPAKNAAADFFFFTEVPKAARGVGFVNNDLTAEFNVLSPNFGEKLAPAWIPISLRDWTGREFHRVYCDEWGNYNFLLHSTFTINVPAPSGVSPHMMTLTLNDPIKADGSIDEFYNPTYSITPWTFQYYPGTTSYLDTPLVPLAAFSASDVKLDTEPNETPVIYSLDGPDAGFGPVIESGAGGTITLQSKGSVSVINPAYDPIVPGSPFKINRNYGFGATEGQVLLDGEPLTISTWTDSTIEAVVPTDATTGRISVVRGDNGAATDVGVTLHVVDYATTTIRYVPAGYASIQAAIDDASPGDLILVAPGTYNENVVMNKPLRLQGSGSGGTIIFGYPNPAEKLTEWHNRINALGPAGFIEANLRDAFVFNEAPAVIVVGQTDVGGTIINPGYPFVTPGQALVDGFTCSGSKAGGGIYVAMGASNLVTSNNDVTGNQGSGGGGITVGYSNATIDVGNANITVCWNKVHKNGGVNGGGGVTIHGGSPGYKVTDNLVIGNITRFSGGGVAHIGLSDAGLIARNKILFNEVFYGVAVGGDGGGIYVASETNPEGPAEFDLGSGSVTILSNLIQGNIAGSGSGGGICAEVVNGLDAVNPDPTTWYSLNVFNNMIVNNVAADDAGGIYLQDAAKANIINNTVANNDSTGTAADAFTAGNLLVSNPQPAGIVSAAHSANLTVNTGQMYSDPAMVNNIVHGNRSFYSDASLNGGTGGLLPNPTTPVWDLAVIGLPGTAYLDPDNCLLTSLTYADGADYDDGTNVAGVPSFTGAYNNTLSTAAVLDEGGNFISVLIGELTIGGGDYHIGCGSPAINIGAPGPLPMFAELNSDYDGQARPGGLYPDAGADEIIPSCSADFDVDGDVDNIDLSLWAGSWLTVCTMYATPPCDLNGDGDVNLEDFAVFATQFGQTNCCP